MYCYKRRLGFSFASHSIPFHGYGKPWTRRFCTRRNWARTNYLHLRSHSVSQLIRIGIHCRLFQDRNLVQGKEDTISDNVTQNNNHNDSNHNPDVPFPNLKREKDDLKRVGLVVSLSAALAGVLFPVFGSQTAVEYITAYIIEESLSVDNLFVFLLIFQYFMVPRASQDRILFWGILGATVLRGLMIWSGTELLQHFRFMSLVFGGFLLYSSFQFLFSQQDSPTSVEENKIYRFATRWIPVTFEKDVDPSAFFVYRRDSQGRQKWLGTPLLLVLVMIELSDVVFALDSIPAVLSVSNDRLVVYVSNLMAILGLRSLFFVLNDLIDKMRFLKPSLSLVLGFIGCKMCAQYFGREWNSIGSLFVVLSILSVGIFLSWRFPKKDDNFGDLS